MAVTKYFFMPVHARTIELYTCEYKCGHKADFQHKIVNHEEKCYCNPENKACRICENCKFEDGFLSCKIKELYFKVEKNSSSENKVYDKDKHIVWEMRNFPESIYSAGDWSEWNEIDEHNKNRPFPTKNCEHFVLGKKVF